MTITNVSDLDRDQAPELHQNDIDSREDLGKGATPLPWFQLTIVFLVMFSEPVASLVIYPFVNQFIRETGITGGDEKKTGYFAGIIESAFFIAEATTVILWGMASDRFGRRPILVLGPLGLAIAMLGFGMSTTFWYLVAFRCFQGVCNGNIGVSKAVMGELTDESNIADAIALIPFMWSLGTTLAPTMGGLLSRPAVRWPDTLGRITYLKDHPYFLPCFAAASIAFITFLVALVGLRETLQSGFQRKREEKRLRSHPPTSSTPLIMDTAVPDYGPGHIGHPDSLISESQEEARNHIDEPVLPSFQAALTPEVLVVLLNYSFLTFCDMCLAVLLPLMWSTSVKNGGLGFTPYTIGLVIGTFGLINSFIQVKFLNKAIKLFGLRNVYIVCFSCMLVTFTCFPIEAYFARQPRGHWRIWVTISIHLAMESLKYAAYGSIQILITVSAPSKSTLGTVNGVAQAVACTMRTVAPLISSSLYALSLQRGWAGGNAVYYILTVIVAFGARLGFLLPETLRLP